FLQTPEELRPDLVAGREQEEVEEHGLDDARDLDAELTNQDAGEEGAHHRPETEAPDLQLADEKAERQREEDRQLRIVPEALDEPAHRLTPSLVCAAVGSRVGCRKPVAHEARIAGHLAFDLSSAIARARVYVISTRSPTFTLSRFLGSRTLTVSVFPSGPLMVTVRAVLSIPSMVAVMVTCCPTAPAGVAPGWDVATPCWEVTPGVASPGFFTSKARAS